MLAAISIFSQVIHFCFLIFCISFIGLHPNLLSFVHIMFKLLKDFLKVALLTA